jgi:hypothetical protein
MDRLIEERRETCFWNLAERPVWLLVGPVVLGRQWADFCSNGEQRRYIVDKNQKKLLAAELELRLFGRVATNRTDIAESAQPDLLLAEIDNKFSDLDL